MTETPPVEPPPSHARSAFHFAGGGACWMLHLLLAYVIAEFGCLTGLGEVHFLNVTVVVWLLLLVTVLVLVLALWATVSARKTLTRKRSQGETGEGDGEYFAARAGFWLNGFFSVVILVESVPLVYFLRAC